MRVANGRRLAAVALLLCGACACADTPAGLRDVFVYPAAYHDITDKYRLKWMDVTYEPGELRAVAYKGGTQIGESTIRTTGAPSALRLTADRQQLGGLWYVAV